MLAALLDALGADPETALALAREMVDWRTVALRSIARGVKLDVIASPDCVTARPIIRMSAWTKST